MKNDEWIDLYYDLCDDSDLNQRLSALINEACHMFREHVNERWEADHKPKYTQLFAAEIKANPFLITPLLSLRDKVVSNLTHAAMDQDEKGA